MLLLKRLLTAIGMFFPFFFILYIGICAVGGGIAGGRSALEHHDAPNQNEFSRQAGADFVKQNLGVILISAFGGAAVFSLAISFSGILPWCKKPVLPPKIPPGRAPL